MTFKVPGASAPGGGYDAFARDARQRGRTGLAHDLQQFAVEDVDHSFDAGLTEGGESPDLRPADADRGRAEGQRLEHVGTAAHAAVEQHGYASADRGRDLREAVERRAQRFLVAAAMVGDDDA